MGQMKGEQRGREEGIGHTGGKGMLFNINWSHRINKTKITKLKKMCLLKRQAKGWEGKWGYWSREVDTGDGIGAGKLYT